MAFITPMKQRTARKDMLYHIIMNDLITLGVIEHPQLKKSDDLVAILEDPKQLERLMSGE